MPKKTDRRILVRSYQLRQLGLTLDQIMDRLAESFEEEELPDRSTISRNLRRFEEKPLQELGEDAPYAWGTMQSIPWEDSRSVLDIWAYYMTNGYEQTLGPLTCRLAKWAWRLLCAMGVEVDDNASEKLSEIKAPTRSELLGVAIEYSWRETAEFILGERFDTTDLDQWLSFRAWDSEIALYGYQEFKYLNGDNSASPIRWHFRDHDWIDKFDPAVANRLKESDHRNEGEESSRNPVSTATLEAWARASDGLLASQVLQYRNAFKRGKQGEDGVPWYFRHLDAVVQSMDGELAKARTRT